MLSVTDPDRTHTGSATQPVELADALAGAPDPPGAGGRWPDDVKDLLVHANDEAQSLRTERVALTARIAELEAQLAKSESTRVRLAARLKELQGALQRRPDSQAERQQQLSARSSEPGRPRPDDQWLTGVVEQTAHVLRSGQKAAQAVVQRARSHAEEIEQAAHRNAAEIRTRAEAEAEKILSVAQFDAESVLEGARSSGRELLAEVQQVRQRAVAQFRQKTAAMQAEIDELEARRISLLQTYAAMRRPVEDAMRVLESAAGDRPNSPARPRGRAVLHWLMNADPPPGEETGAGR